MNAMPGKYGVLTRIFADCWTCYILQMKVYVEKSENAIPASTGIWKIISKSDLEFCT